MPIDYKKYPSNWKTKIRPAILTRAENRCEFCGVKNYAIGYRDENGVFISARDGRLKIILTIAHLNHDIADNRPENLKALCQKCHLNYDREHHRKTKSNNHNKRSR